LDVQSSPKAIKQRSELLSAYDTLTSHLTTTFTALAMAMAEVRKDDEKKASTSSHRAYLAIVLGPSLGTAKSKVFLGIDHLGMHVNPGGGDGTGDEMEDESSSESDEEDSESTSEDEESGEAEGEEEEEKEDEGEGEEGPSDSESEEEEDDEKESSEDSDTGPVLEQAGRKVLLQTPLSKPNARQPKAVSPPTITHAEEQRFLQNADRLLSRTLAAADAEGYGLASEMCKRLAALIWTSLTPHFSHNSNARLNSCPS
jgi:hypothetical protein